MEEGSRILKKLHAAVKSEILPIVDYAEKRVVEGSLRLKWNLQRSIKQVAIYGRQYLKDAAYYVKTHKARKGKTLSLHAHEVACITKGKVGKKREFGRVFHVGRIGGNFLIALCTGVQLADKKAIKPALEKHEELFGPDALESLATDRGFHSNQNIKLAKKKGVAEIGIQKPGPVEDDPTQEKLRRRRAGIEPLLGHAKRFGLGRSKMKGDKSTHGSGFTSIMGFNLSQLERKLKDRMLKMAG
jgi:transposase, IS5 family